MEISCLFFLYIEKNIVFRRILLYNIPKEPFRSRGFFSVFHRKKKRAMKRGHVFVEEDYYEEDIVCRFRVRAIYEDRRTGRCCRSPAERVR